MPGGVSKVLADPKPSSYYATYRREMLPFVPANCRRLLDVGCGAGGFGALVKRERGIEVWGAEYEPPAAELAAGQLDRVICGDFVTVAGLPDGYFDVVMFNDSLEHFPYTDPPLQRAKKLLRDGGVVIASIPNVRYIDNVYHFLIERDWRYAESGILDNTHLRFFTKRSMVRTFEDAGYDVDSITGINSHYWSGKKIFLLRLFFGRWIEDMRYLQYVVTARPKAAGG